MTQPVEVEDPAEEVVNAFIAAMRKAFNPDDAVQAPIGGGSTVVRFVAGDVAAMELWDAHAAGGDCKEPFLWVRLMRRYRSKTFPTPSPASDNCELPRVVDIEVGVARCAAISEDGTVDWEQVAQEAEISRDDSWRIELALCIAGSALRKNHQVATNTVLPTGPEGGVIGWGGTAAVQL